MESSYSAFPERRQPCLCGPCLWLAPLGLVAVISAALVHLQSIGPEHHTIDGDLTAAMPMERQQGQGQACYMPPGPMPHKYALSYVTPVELQMERGGCWMFAAISLLEHSYRRQGVANGWLAPTQYLKLSQQAFGVSVLDVCRKAPNACLFDGDRIHTGNSTEGGEVAVLYYLRALESSAALPWSTCPYTPVKGRDRECPGLAEAQRLSPLSFMVRGMNTYYESVDTKRALLRDGRILSLGMPMANVRYLLPCNDTAQLLAQHYPQHVRRPAECDTAACEPCPLERAFVGVGCCVASDREMHTMGGEFFFHEDLSLSLEGGHAVNLVGYSDTFQTEHNHVGGWIVKNSWWDGLPPSEQFWHHARGSHSIEFFLQTISATDEAEICPNSHSPRSWYTCNDLANCRDPITATYARVSRRVLRLVCIDRSQYALGVCNPGDIYFLKHLEPLGGGLAFGGGLTSACLIYDDPTVVTGAAGDNGPVVSRRTSRRRMPQERIDPVTTADGDLCTPPLPIDDLAMIFAPVPEEFRPNDPDLCGFYFMPYTVLDMLGRRFGGWFATDVDVVWSQESYAAAGAPQWASGSMPAQYTFLAKDTHEQRTAKFGGSPFPNVQRPVS